MKKRLNRLTEEDFAGLSASVQSGRQSPSSLGKALLLAPFIFGVLLTVGNLFVFADRAIPADDIVILITYILDALAFILIILAFIFSIKKIYRAKPSIQYMVSTVIIQAMFGLYPLAIVMYMIYDDRQFHHHYGIGSGKMLVIIASILITGLAVFIYAFLRKLNSLEAGEYRSDKEVDIDEEIAEEREVDYDKIMRIVVIGFIIILAVLRFMIGVTDWDMLFIVGIFMLIFYTMLFILPEQLIIQYCIKRFASFRMQEQK